MAEINPLILVKPNKQDCGKKAGKPHGKEKRTNSEELENKQKKNDVSFTPKSFFGNKSPKDGIEGRLTNLGAATGTNTSAFDLQLDKNFVSMAGENPFPPAGQCTQPTMKWKRNKTQTKRLVTNAGKTIQNSKRRKDGMEEQYV